MDDGSLRVIVRQVLASEQLLTPASEALGTDVTASWLQAVELTGQAWDARMARRRAARAQGAPPLANPPTAS